MDAEEEGRNSSFSGIKNLKVSEKKESYFTITEFGNRKFDPQKWGLELLQSRTESHKVDYLFKVLDEAASEGNADALQKVYFFSTQESMGINRVNPNKAAQALREGLLRDHYWVIPIYEAKLKSLQHVSEELIRIKNSKGNVENLTLQQEELIRLHREVANTPLQSPNTVTQSEKFLEFLYPFRAQTWVEGFLEGRHKENIDTMLARLKSYGYYKHFAGLYEEVSHVKGKKPKALEFLGKEHQFLLEGAALHDPTAFNNLYGYYTKNKKWKDVMELCQRLAKERELMKFMYTLGAEYIKGDIVEKSPQKGFEWLTKAAEKAMEEFSKKKNSQHQNYSRNIFNMAIIELIKNYWYPKGDKQDPAKTFKWLCALEPEATRCMEKKEKQQDDLGSAQVFVLLGCCYHYGQGVEKDAKKAFAYFNQAAQLGEKNASIHLAMAYQYGKGVEKDLVEAIKRWENISSRNPEERVYMGLCYDDRGYELQQQEDRKNATKFFKKAYVCYKQAAEEKNSQALFNMAVHHYKGLSAKKDLKVTKDLLTAAAETGHVEAMYGIGSVSLLEKPKDLQKAEHWLQEAANKGHLTAMVDLGWLYAEEYTKDLEAFNWFKKAADLGHAIAQYNCGVLLLYKRVSGDNSHEDDALSYLNKAAEQGYASAMMLLGKYYLERSDTESEKGQQNSESAIFWLKKAASLGNFEAKTLLKETEEKQELETEESLPSQDLEKCLKNLENIENGAVDTTKELEIKVEKRPLPFVDHTKDDNKTESSSDESEIVGSKTGTEEGLTTASSVALQTTESSAQEDKRVSSFL